MGAAKVKVCRFIDCIVGDQDFATAQTDADMAQSSGRAQTVNHGRADVHFDRCLFRGQKHRFLTWPARRSVAMVQPAPSPPEAISCR